MPKRRLYSKPFSKKCVNATVDYLEDKPVEPGLILYVTTGSCEDETNAPTTMAFGKKNGGKFITLEEESTPIAGITKYIMKTHHFIAGEAPAFRFEGATLNDVLSGYLEGYYEELT